MFLLTSLLSLLRQIIGEVQLVAELGDLLIRSGDLSTQGLGLSSKSRLLNLSVVRERLHLIRQLGNTEVCLREFVVVLCGLLVTLLIDLPLLRVLDPKLLDLEHRCLVVCGLELLNCCSLEGQARLSLSSFLQIFLVLLPESLLVISLLVSLRLERSVGVLETLDLGASGLELSL